MSDIIKCFFTHSKLLWRSYSIHESSERFKIRSVEIFLSRRNDQCARIRDIFRTFHYKKKCFKIKIWRNLSFGNDSTTSANPPKLYCKIFLKSFSLLTEALNRNRMINEAQIDDPNLIFFFRELFQNTYTRGIEVDKRDES